MKSFFMSILVFGTFSMGHAALPQQLEKALNDQISAEFDGAQTYLQLSTIYAEKSLSGIAHFFIVQYYEELNHARMLMDYVQRKNGTVTLSPVMMEPYDASTVFLGFQSSLELEETQTQRINTLQNLARTLNHNETFTFLNWFVTEQTQEEDMFQSLVDKLNLIGSSPEGLLQIDATLGLRPMPAVFVPPV
jgi:ferritin